MRSKKNFFPTFLLTLLLFLILLYLVLFTAPENPIFVLVFYFLSFAFCFFLFSLVLASSRRGFLVALGLMGLLFFKQVGVFNPLNLILWSSLLLALTIFFSRR